MIILIDWAYNTINYQALAVFQSLNVFTQWSYVLCNGPNVFFPSLPPMLEYRFESRLGLEFSGFSTWHFLKLIVRGFLCVLQVPPHLH